MGCIASAICLIKQKWNPNEFTTSMNHNHQHFTVFIVFLIIFHLYVYKYFYFCLFMCHDHCPSTNHTNKITYKINITSQSFATFKIFSSIFISSSTSFSSAITRLSYTALCISVFCSTDSCTSCSWSSFETWQHLQQQQHLAVNATTTLSQGSREWAQRGRKSQDRNLAGRHPGFLFCSTLITTTMINRTTKGTPTPTRTCQPASDRLNTKRGNTKKQRMMYTAANQR